MDFAAFWTAYEDIVRKARDAKLTVEDFQGTTISLTNPGTIGTNHSVPRLMRGQGAIIGVGAMEYPPEWQGASEEAIARNAISKVMTLTSTYDHRVIQGAQSGDFLKRAPPAAAGRGRLLRRDLPGAADPLRADPLEQRHRDVARRRDLQAGAHPRADPRLPGARPPDGRHRPAGVPPAQPPRPRGGVARAHAVGPRPRVRHRLLRRRGPPVHEAAPHPRHPARLLLPHHRHRVHAHHGSRAAQVDPGARRATAHQAASRGAAADPAQAQPGRGVRDVPADQVRRAEALQPRGRRDHDPGARRDLRGRRRDRARRGHHGHGPPWPAQRAGQHRRQEVLPDLPRVRGQHRPAHRAGIRRREVPPRGRGRVPLGPRRPDQGLRRGQPVATSRRSTPCSKASPGPSRTCSTAARSTPCSRCWCTATRRSPGRASSPRR